jgi:hypothetical protein
LNPCSACAWESWGTAMTFAGWVSRPADDG